MKLSIANLEKIAAHGAVRVPSQAELALPEKVLQFGTGVLLRGLPDFVINKANRQGLFNGRIVVVKSTATGDATAFETQDGLYTVCIRGISGGEKIEENHLVSAISRVLSAATEWEEVLQCAANPQMQVIVSNTTELGIELTKDNVHATPPTSFPGKLLAFLYQRYKIFDGSEDSGLVIIPTELIPDNADKLLSILLELAHQNGLEIAFIDWIENANYFCNSLVDRIVPGRFSYTENAIVQAQLGYEDELMVMSEEYALWAIQTSSEKVKSILSFAGADNTTVLAADIAKFREIKLRLLNGSHTFSAALATLAGFTTVKEAMADATFNQYINRLMQEAIIPAIESETISTSEAQKFAAAVIDRYSNPYVDHLWANICMQSASKMVTRNLQLLTNYAARFGEPSPLMSLGLAAQILYMNISQEADGKYYGTLNGKSYLVTDQHAALYQQAWQQADAGKAVKSILQAEQLWGTKLSTLPGLTASVTFWIQLLQQEGAAAAIQAALGEKLLSTNEE